MKAPFPYFGGKSRVAAEVWKRFGEVKNYVEPFFGSGAVLLGRPDAPKVETINDADCFVSNFWRAIKHAPDEVAKYADWPVNEADLLARNLWLTQQDEFRARMKSEPDFFDAKIAGWWVWGLCSWIGSGFCEARPRKKRPHLGNGNGVHRKNLDHYSVADLIEALSNRLRNVRVACGDWSRVLTYSPTTCHGLTAVFLDPPYADTADRRKKLYTVDSQTVAHDVCAWAVEHGDDPKLRIALCGYEGEHEMPESWECFAWRGCGYGAGCGAAGDANRRKERIWFSPGCEVSS